MRCPQLVFRCRIALPLTGLVLCGISCTQPPAARSVVDERQPVQVRLVRQPGCCQGARSKLAAMVEQQLARQPSLKLIVEEQPVSEAPSREAEVIAAATRELRSTLAHVKDLYLQMQMKAVQSEVGQALDVMRRYAGADLTPEEISSLHMYLAAVSQVTGQHAQSREHAEAAVRFNPKVRADPDVFSPPVRAEIEKARYVQKAVSVKITSAPAGARVFWDGAALGETPLLLTAQVPGEHYLRLQRAGSVTWRDRVVVKDAIPIEVKLRDLPVRGLPTSRVSAELLLFDANGEGLQLTRRPLVGALRTVHVAASSSEAQAERAVRTLFGPATRSANTEGSSRERSHWRRYWWAYAAAGIVVVLSVIIPIAASSGGSNGRPVTMPIP